MCFGVCREGVSADGGAWAKAPLSPSLEAAGSGYLWEVHMWCLVSPESTELHPALGQRVVFAFQRSANFVFPACCQLMYFSQLCNYQSSGAETCLLSAWLGAIRDPCLWHHLKAMGICTCASAGS